VYKLHTIRITDIVMESIQRNGKIIIKTLLEDEWTSHDWYNYWKNLLQFQCKLFSPFVLLNYCVGWGELPFVKNCCSHDFRSFSYLIAQRALFMTNSDCSLNCVLYEHLDIKSFLDWSRFHLGVWRSYGQSKVL